MHLVSIKHERGQNAKAIDLTNSLFNELLLSAFLSLFYGCQMEAELLNFKENVDAWVKEIRGELTRVQDVSYIIEENVNNTEHNYELISELRTDIEELKHEINALKIIQIATLKSQMKRKALPL